jgi:hypothetical protein
MSLFILDGFIYLRPGYGEIDCVLHAKAGRNSRFLPISFQGGF